MSRIASRLSAWSLSMLAVLILSSGCVSRGNSPIFKRLPLAHVLPAGSELEVAGAHLPLVVRVQRPTDGTPCAWLVALQWPVEAGRDYRVERGGELLRVVNGGEGSAATTMVFAVLETEPGEWTVIEED